MSLLPEFKYSVRIWLVVEFVLIFFIAGIKATEGQNCKPIRVGIFSDCQYCDRPSVGNRNYRFSLSKLDSCISTLNSLAPDAIFHLGDMIDQDYRSYDLVIPKLQQFSSPVNLVLGNHDYMIKKRFKPGLLNRIGMKEDHYVVDFGNWRFIVLNGDDLSFFAPQDKKHKQERNDMVCDQFQQFHLNGMPWNGGIAYDQMKWLEMELNDSEQSNRKVIVFCHFPLFTKDNHNLFNNEELFALLSRYASVKAYFCGHYHSGNYKVKNGVHLVNFKGMVDTDQNAFSLVTLTSDSILIKGYGREPDRKLKIR